MKNIMIYKNVEKAIRKTFKEEETKTDKKYFLDDLNRVLSELYSELEE